MAAVHTHSPFQGTLTILLKLPSQCGGFTQFKRHVDQFDGHSTLVGKATSREAYDGHVSVSLSALNASLQPSYVRCYTHHGKACTWWGRVRGAPLPVVPLVRLQYFTAPTRALTPRGCVTCDLVTTWGILAPSIAVMTRCRSRSMCYSLLMLPPG
jgi:hypothetical protein